MYTPMFFGMMAMALILVHANTQPNKVVKREAVQPMVPASTSNSIAFYAYRTSGLHIPEGTAKTLDYAGTHLNTGNALNNNTGVFTAPVKGIYYFFFSCVKHWNFATLTIRLMKNSEEISTAHVRAQEWGTKGDGANYVPLDVQATLSLNVKDTVYVVLLNNGNNTFVKGGAITDELPPVEFDHVTSFTGFLIHKM